MRAGLGLLAVPLPRALLPAAACCPGPASAVARLRGGRRGGGRSPLSSSASLSDWARARDSSPAWAKGVPIAVRARSVSAWMRLISSEDLVAVGAEVGELVLQPGDQPDGRLVRCQAEFGFGDPHSRDGHAVEPQVRPHLIAGTPGGRGDDGEPAERADPRLIAGTGALPGLGDLGVQQAAQAVGGVGSLAERLPVQARW